jgi:PAS domain S-box-containing protein
LQETPQPSAATADAVLNYARLFDTPQQAVIGTTRAGSIVYWSYAAERFYGWRADDVLGRNIVEVTSADAARHAAEDIMEALSAGKSWVGTFPVRRSDGSEIEVEVSNLPVRNATGTLVGIVGVSSLPGPPQT